MKKSFLFTAMVLGLFFLVAGCRSAALEGYLDIMKEKGGISQDYLAVLNKWSRDQILHSQFETKVRIAATYKSRDFIAAYAKEYARLYLSTKEEEKRGAEALTERASEVMEFLVYAYIPDRAYNDFDKKNSVWTVFLEDEKGQRYRPADLRQIEKVTPVIEGFYPYGNQYYGRYYVLTFNPIAPSGKTPPVFKLVFTSVMGRIELEWKN
jgi:hypothetical protein